MRNGVGRLVLFVVAAGVDRDVACSGSRPADAFREVSLSAHHRSAAERSLGQAERDDGSAVVVKRHSGQVAATADRGDCWDAGAERCLKKLSPEFTQL